MSEDMQEGQGQAHEADAVTTTGAAPGETEKAAASKTDASKPERTVPYARFQEVVNARNELAAQLKLLQDAQVETEKTFGEMRKQFEQTQTELGSERLARLRVETAARKGLPLELAPRLSGGNAAELEADAENLLQFVRTEKSVPPAPGVPPPARGSATKLDLRNMTPAEIRAKREEILATR